jgi:hypothetical protein
MAKRYTKLSKAAKKRLGLSIRHTYWRDNLTGQIQTQRQHEKQIIRERNARLKARRLEKQRTAKILPAIKNIDQNYLTVYGYIVRNTPQEKQNLNNLQRGILGNPVATAYAANLIRQDKADISILMEIPNDKKSGYLEKIRTLNYKYIDLVEEADPERNPFWYH